MPFAFPSRPGLIAPLWRRWPACFDMPAMCVGAAMPDVVDGIIGLSRGHLGQGLGHSFVGLFLLCVPFGVPLWWGLHRFARRVPRSERGGFLARSWNMGNDAIAATPGPEAFPRNGALVLWSLLVGAFSHMFFDLISHAEFSWLMPWREKMDIFPAWWTWTWFRAPIPGYVNGYPMAPHFAVWCLLGVLGAWLLFKPALATNDKPGRPQE